MTTALPIVRTEMMALGDMTPADYNPREMGEEQRAGLRASMQRFGVVQDIVWNKRTGNIVGGHQRHGVLLEDEGSDYELEVKIVDLDDNEEKALNIALNNPHTSGQFTPEVVDLIRELQETDLSDLIGELQLDALLPLNDTGFLDDLLGGGGDEGNGGTSGSAPVTEHTDFVVPLSPAQNQVVYDTLRAVKVQLRDQTDEADTAAALTHLCNSWNRKG
jgi:hypothetical protein